MATFATRFKDLRTQEGLSQTGIAEEIGVSKGTISIWERGERKPELGTLEKVALYFDVTLAYLLGDSDDASERYGEGKGESRTGWITEVDAGEVRDLAMQLARLSPESRRIVSGAIVEAFRYDRERGALKPEEEVELSLRYLEWTE